MNIFATVKARVRTRNRPKSEEIVKAGVCNERGAGSAHLVVTAMIEGHL